ncbi:hypothetical protein OG604_19065 [Streptomyces sp. NBC_01231]|nr:hypothetical protein OG604_19065 [Streptomyces sp. NBC_01231]
MPSTDRAPRALCLSFLSLPPLLGAAPAATAAETAGTAMTGETAETAGTADSRPVAPSGGARPELTGATT